MTEQMQSAEALAKVECPAARDPAVRLFIVAAILIAAGVWCFVDVHLKNKYPWKEDMKLNDAVTYYFNHGGAVVLPLLGLIPLVWGVVLLRRKLVADDEGIGYLGKEKIPWSAVRSLDSSKLSDKGILLLRYDAGGPEKTLTLDSWKLQNFRPLVLLLEKKVASAS